MHPSSSTVARAVAAAMLIAASASPSFAACTRLGFSVNDYGKDGPTKDAKGLLDKYIAKWAGDHKIAKYQTGPKDVKCDLFLNFIVFDEHTCRAEATVCWDGAPVTPPVVKAEGAAPDSKPAANPKTPAAKRAAATAPGTAPAAGAAKPAAQAAVPAAAKPVAQTPVVAPIETGTLPAVAKPVAPAPAAAAAPAPAAPAVPKTVAAEPIADQALAAAQKAAAAAERAAAAAERAAAAAQAAERANMPAAAKP